MCGFRGLLASSNKSETERTAARSGLPYNPTLQWTGPAQRSLALESSSAPGPSSECRCVMPQENLQIVQRLDVGLYEADGSYREEFVRNPSWLDIEAQPRCR